MRPIPALGIALAAACAALALSACKGQDAAKSGDAATGAQASSGGAAAGPISLTDMPHPKPGLWKVSMAMDGVARPMNMETCLDAASEANMAALGNEVAKSRKCEKRSMTRGLDGSIHITSSCNLDQMGNSETTTDVSGDFNSHYTVKSDTTRTGAAIASANGHHSMVMDMAWVGPCGPGQKGGDMVMNGVPIHAGGMGGMPMAAKP